MRVRTGCNAQLGSAVGAKSMYERACCHTISGLPLMSTTFTLAISIDCTAIFTLIRSIPAKLIGQCIPGSLSTPMNCT